MVNDKVLVCNETSALKDCWWYPKSKPKQVQHATFELELTKIMETSYFHLVSSTWSFHLKAHTFNAMVW